MIKYIILGITQGLTEFLPVSSSAHLVILQHIFGITDNLVAISVVLHLGTLLALLIFFFRDILKLFGDKKLLLYISVVTVITGAIGVMGKDFFEKLFESYKASAFALIFTGIMLLAVSRMVNNAKRVNLNIKDALILGFTQAIAIIPGISRSGTTISTLFFRGIEKETSFRFSFLVSIPVILGAALFELRHVGNSLSAQLPQLAIGFIFSFLSGLAALGLLRIVLRRAKLHYFGYYCIIVAILTLFFIT